MSKYLCANCVAKEQCGGEWTMYCASYVPKEHKQTNEEWFASLSTEEKAEWIVETFLLTYGAYWVVHNEKLLNSATWVEWLKQPHGEE